MPDMARQPTKRELQKRRERRAAITADRDRAAAAKGQGKQDRDKRSKLPKSIMGAKYVRLLEKQVQQLRDEEQQHGNRELFLDDVFVAYLLAFFNPTIRSLRTIEDLSLTGQAQKHLSIRKICKSTLSDFNQLVDPERLQPILAGLRRQLSRKLAGNPIHDRDLHALLSQTIAVDGTFLPAVADVTWAIANSNNHGTLRHRARIDARIHVSTWLPEAMVVPELGESESDSAIRHIQPGKIYVYDRGYTGFALLRAHYGSLSPGQHKDVLPLQSHFVVRYKKPGQNSPELSDAIDQTLTEEDLQAGVVSDRIGYFRSDSAQQAGLAHTQLREVVIPYEDNGTPKKLRLITNLFDISAATIALLYKYRWQVELFFRWLKSFGNFNHLISHSRDGVLTHLYVTIIGVMLMYLHTGYRPSKYLFSMLSLVASGGATLEEVIPILRERERRSELDRQSAARRRERKKNEGR
jgi:hypothetical protein